MEMASLAVRNTNLTVSTAALEIRTAGSRAELMEISFIATGNAPSIGLGRPVDRGVTPTSSATFERDEPGSPVCVTTAALSWTTGPTSPLVFIRRFNHQSLQGVGVIWTFPQGLVIPINSSLVVWNIFSGSVYDINMVIVE